MAELSVACPICKQSLTAPNEDELAKVFKEHAKHEHGMEMSEEEAKEKVKMGIWFAETATQKPSPYLGESSVGIVSCGDSCSACYLPGTRISSPR